MARYVFEWIFIFLFCEYLICGAEMFCICSIQSCPFSQLCCDKKSFSFGFGKLWFYIPTASGSEEISRNVSAVTAKDTGDGISESGFAIVTFTIGNDEGFYINFLAAKSTIL